MNPSTLSNPNEDVSSKKPSKNPSKPSKRKLAHFPLPAYGKTRIHTSVLFYRNKWQECNRRIHISDETRRLRHLWVRNAFLRYLAKKCVKKRPRIEKI
jgi:hypothetical protein